MSPTVWKGYTGQQAAIVFHINIRGRHPKSSTVFADGVFKCIAGTDRPSDSRDLFGLLVEEFRKEGKVAQDRSQNPAVDIGVIVDAQLSGGGHDDREPQAIDGGGWLYHTGQFAMIFDKATT